MTSRLTRRWLLLGLSAAAVMVLALSAAGYLFLLSDGGSPSARDSARVSSTTDTSQTQPSLPAVLTPDSRREELSPLAQVDPAKLEGAFQRCSECHSLLDRTASVNPALTDGFKHDFHLEKGAECEDCHFAPTHTPESIRRPDMAKCFTCHSQIDAQAPPGSCDLCHPPEFELEPGSHQDADWVPPSERMDAVQAKHSTAGPKPKECELCHDTGKFCKDCHKVDMPHAENWQTSHSVPARDAGGGKACVQCHPDRTACKVCHHPGYTPEGPPWWKLHPQTAFEIGVERCIGCHSTKTCAHCHTTGEYIEYGE